MLTDKVLADMTVDVIDALQNPAISTELRIMARYAGYLIDEVNRLKRTEHRDLVAEHAAYVQRWRAMSAKDRDAALGLDNKQPMNWVHLDPPMTGGGVLTMMFCGVCTFCQSGLYDDCPNKRVTVTDAG